MTESQVARSTCDPLCRSQDVYKATFNHVMNGGAHRLRAFRKQDPHRCVPYHQETCSSLARVWLSSSSIHVGYNRKFLASLCST